MKNEKIIVEGMTCGHCISTVEGALRMIGVKGQADLKLGEVQVEYDEDKNDITQIKSAISATGYIVP